MPKVFVSYRRTDSQYAAGWIYERLAGHFGRESVFMDLDSIPFGVDFREHLDEAVGRCDVLLAVIGESWLETRDGRGQRRLDDASDFVRIEIESALARGIPVVPVLVGRATMPGEEELPESLRRLAFRNATEVRPGRDFGDHVTRLIRGIEHLQIVLKPAAAVAARSASEGKSAVVVAVPVAPVAPRKKEPAATFENSIGMKFVLVKPGKFLMGSPANEANRSDDEQQHEVTITKVFWMGVHQVTVGQWKRFAATGYQTEAERGDGSYGWTGSKWEQDRKYNWQSPGFRQDDSHPVTCVTWDDAVAFCEWLKKSDPERLYRLPSEAEWEYSCRGGVRSSPLPFHFQQPTSSLSSTQANFNGNYPYGDAANGPYWQSTTPVGSFEANVLGIFDMHGNVWEWCLDWYDANYCTSGPATDPPGPSSGSVRVIRGGSWFYRGRRCRAAHRGRLTPSYRNFYLGFRVAAVPHE